MGYPLYGHELVRERTPAGHVAAQRQVATWSRREGGTDVALKMRFLDFSKPFIGREAVRRELDSGAGRVLVGLRLAGRQAARPPAAVLAGNEPVGAVTSGLFAPSLNAAVALAYVDRAVSRAGQALELPERGKNLPATVAPLPFYPRGTARGKVIGNR
jgi:aminomethyltransferase